MRTLRIMIMKSFFPIFFIAVLFFVLLLQLVDIFGNLWRYLNQDVPLASIVQVAFLYIPKCVSLALSASLLFAIAFTLGNLYAANELIAVFASGISLFVLSSPSILLGLLLSVGGYFFEERWLLDTFARKNELSRELLNQRTSQSNTKVTVLSDNGQDCVLR